MKKISILLAGMMAVGVCHAAPTQRNVARFKSVAAQRPQLKKEAATPLWLPTVEKEFYDDNGWTQIAEARYEYDNKGNITRIRLDDSGSVFTTIFEYNDDNMPVLRVETAGEGSAERNTLKRTYEYDPIVKSYCVLRMGYSWAGNDWVADYACEKNIITRNEAGNITDIIKYLPLDSETFVPAYHTEWKYDDPDGQATGFAYYLNMSGEEDGDWKLYGDTDYRDIEWENFDGQPVGDFLEQIVGANRIKSARAYYEDVVDGYVFVEYPQDGAYGYLMKFTTNDPEEVGITRQVETIDANGSVRYTLCEYFDDETEDIYDTPVYTYITTLIYNDHGDVESEQMTEQFGDSEPELVACEEYANTYDEDGHLVEMIQRTYDYEEGEFFDARRVVYEGYVDVTSGVASAVVAPAGLRLDNGVAVAEGDITAYAPDGRMVASAAGSLDASALGRGIWILRSGNETLKIVNLK